MLVTTIFNNVKLSKNDIHYHKKKVIRDLTELFILTMLTLVLVFNYLNFLGIDMKQTLIISVILAATVFVINIVINRHIFFDSVIENMTNSNDNIFNSVPSAYKLMKNDQQNFNFSDKFSFSLFERSPPMTKVEQDMIVTEDMQFNDSRKVPLKLHVVFKDDLEKINNNSNNNSNKTTTGMLGTTTGMSGTTTGMSITTQAPTTQAPTTTGMLGTTTGMSGTTTGMLGTTTGMLGTTTGMLGTTTGMLGTTTGMSGTTTQAPTTQAGTTTV